MPGPHLFRVSRAKGALTTHVDDVRGCGDQEVLRLARRDLQHRFGDLGAQEKDFVDFGLEWTQTDDFSAQLADGNLTNALKPIPTTPKLWASRQHKCKLETSAGWQRRRGRTFALGWHGWQQRWAPTTEVASAEARTSPRRRRSGNRAQF